MSRVIHAISMTSFNWVKPHSRTKTPAISSNQFFLVTILISLILFSAFMIVYIKYLNRRLFIQYQQLQQIEQQARIDRGKLLLERTTLSSQERIQTLAQGLHMVIPSRKHIVIISG